MTLLNVQLRRLLLLCDHRNKTDLRRDKDTFSRQMSCKFYCHQWKVWHILQHCLWHNTVCRFLLKICTLVDTKFFSSNLIWIYLKKRLQLYFCDLLPKLYSTSSQEGFRFWIFFSSSNYQKRTLFEDTKGVIKIRKSKKNRQHNGQKKKEKRTNNDLQSIQIELKME
jgi:hypothetical protein